MDCFVASLLAMTTRGRQITGKKENENGKKASNE
jgi:hypothetical protein